MASFPHAEKAGSKSRKKEAEQVKSIKYELLGFGALSFLLFLLLALPGGEEVRKKLRSPVELITSKTAVQRE
jgi:hypothetical protein